MTDDFNACPTTIEAAVAAIPADDASHTTAVRRRALAGLAERIGTHTSVIRVHELATHVEVDIAVGGSASALERARLTAATIDHILEDATGVTVRIVSITA